MAGGPPALRLFATDREHFNSDVGWEGEAAGTAATVTSVEPLAQGREFTAYGPSHWIVLLMFISGTALLVILGRR